jgi:FkbM family methyltransferase
MESLEDWFARIDVPTLASAVHVGAGRGAVVDMYRRLVASGRLARVVLVEGNAEAAESLRLATAGQPAFIVEATAVAPATGTVDWHSHSLADLDGALDQSALRSVYPRLTHLGSRRMSAVALGELVERHVATHAAKPSLLVLDVPGQDTALLGGLDPTLLERFEWILVRGSAGRIGAPGGTFAHSQTWLSDHGYAVVAADDRTQPLWPSSLFRFDRRAWEVKECRQRAAQLEAALKERTTEAQQVRFELAAAQREVQAQNARVEELKLSREHAARLEAALKDRTVEAQAALERAELATATLGQVRAELAAARSDAQAQDGLLQGVRVELEQVRAELAAARREAQTQSARIDELRTANEAAARELAERDMRQHLLDVEIAKAEAQLELVKDILIREKNF